MLQTPSIFLSVQIGRSAQRSARAWVLPSRHMIFALECQCMPSCILQELPEITWTVARFHVYAPSSTQIYMLRSIRRAWAFPSVMCELSRPFCYPTITNSSPNPCMSRYTGSDEMRSGNTYIVLFVSRIHIVDRRISYLPVRRAKYQITRQQACSQISHPLHHHLLPSSFFFSIFFHFVFHFVRDAVR